MEGCYLTTKAPGWVQPAAVCTGAFPRSRVVVRAAGDSSKKGFGNVEKEEKKGKKGGRQQKAVVVKEGSREMKKLISSVEKESNAEQHRKLNIDPQVAAKGKVDFVRVESWGDESQTEADLENLKLKTFSSGFDSSDYSAPFYEQLVRRIQLLESKGEISVVQAQPLPPFEKWVFGINRYAQYLVDQHAVHEALEGVIEAINQVSREEADGAVQAVCLFSSALGLQRAEAIAVDLKRLSEESSTAGPSEPTTQTLSYAKYIQRLGKLASGVGDEGKEACLRLLAHIFSVQIAHLTTGMRVGSKALNDLTVVRSAKAVSFYRDYPQEAADPLRVLILACNKAGKLISKEADLEQVMQELPKAIQKTSLLLSVLAVVDQSALAS